MATEFKLPELGEDIHSGYVINLYVSPGDKISKDDPVMEIETDKAALEIPAPVSGTVKEVHVKEDETIEVGQLLITIQEEGGEEAAATEEEDISEAAKEPEPDADQEVKTDEQKESHIEEKELSETEGHTLEEEPELRVVEDEEPEEEVPSQKITPVARRLAEQHDVPLEDVTGTGTNSRITKSDVESYLEERSQKAESIPGEAEEEREKKEPVPASPAVRRLARELGVEINEVPGSGPEGRISEDDVKSHARRLLKDLTGEEREPEPSSQPEEPSLPNFTKWGEVEREPMDTVRRRTAENVSFSWRTVSHVTQNDKADITELEKLRKRYSKQVEEAGGSLTITPIILKVVASALQLFPRFNASIDMKSEEIVFKNYCHIRVAVDTERGLLVPVIRDVDKKNITEISAELVDIVERARNKRLTLDEMQGGTFTVSNQGGIGGTHFSPIVYWPEVAVLGVSRARTEAVFLDGDFEPRLLLPLSLSYDHRIIDGADAARFVRWICEALEEPFSLLLEG